MTYPIKVLGHRGAMKEGFYENTLDGFAAALAHSDGLETDAVRSLDGHVFLIHETDASNSIVHYELTRHLDHESAAAISHQRTDQLTANQISHLTLQNGAHIPNLVDLLTLLKQHPNAVLNIELKAHNTANAVATLLAKHQIKPEQVFVSSFNHPELARFRKLAPLYKVGILFDAAEALRIPMFPWLKTEHDAYYQPFDMRYLRSELIQNLVPDYIGLNSRDLSFTAIQGIEAALPDAQTYVWWNIVNDMPPADMPENFFTLLADLNRSSPNISALITNHPQKMTEALKARGLR